MKTRDLSAATSAALATTVTKPGFLVEIVLASTTFRLSSRGAITWSGRNFLDFGVDVRGLSSTGGQEAGAGSLTIEDPDLTFSTMLLIDGVADAPVRIWAFYGDSDPAGLDPFIVFQGVADDAKIDTGAMRVTVSLLQQRVSTTYSPRIYMTRENGFRFLPPKGTVLSWGGENFELRGE